jgi:hypothetical protein
MEEWDREYRVGSTVSVARYPVECAVVVVGSLIEQCMDFQE